ncbi:histone-lysine N-methyltransferase SETMAR [Trichonephila clavipes]|nr:histone-lysine N-methyltransferase SETMAR [Trichonephila clavipes]
MIQFLWAKNVSASEIHSQFAEVYVDEAMNRQHVVKWCHSFQSGKTECRKLQYGRERTAKSFTEQIDEMIQNNRRVTLREISSELRLSYGSVQHTISDVLRYSNSVL